MPTIDVDAPDFDRFRAENPTAERKSLEFTERRFHNALRILLNIDRFELEDVGAIPKGAPGDGLWNAWKSNPFIFFIRADDGKADAIWGIMQGRMR